MKLVSKNMFNSPRIQSRYLKTLPCPGRALASTTFGPSQSPTRAMATKIKQIMFKLPKRFPCMEAKFFFVIFFLLNFSFVLSSIWQKNVSGCRLLQAYLSILYLSRNTVTLSLFFTLSLSQIQTLYHVFSLSLYSLTYSLSHLLSLSLSFCLFLSISYSVSLTHIFPLFLSLSLSLSLSNSFSLTQNDTLTVSKLNLL